MVERLFVLKNGNLTDEMESGNLSKSHSFNTEDDDDSAANESVANESVANESIQQGEDESSPKTKPAISLSPDDHKRRLLLLASPSIDSINDPEGSVSDIPSAEKAKKKKRRTIDKPDILQLKKVLKKRPWYTRIDYEIFIKPLIGIGILVLLYFAWVKRDVWIPRLLTSETRLRHTILRNQEKLSERGELSTTNKDVSPSGEDNIVDDNNDEDNDEQLPTPDNDDDDNNNNNNNNAPTTHPKHSQKLNIRIRRNKMSFSKDKQAKKSRGARNKIADGDDADVGDDDDDDDDDDNIDADNVDENIDDDVSETDKSNEETVIKPVKGKEKVSSSKKHHHQQQHKHQIKLSNEKHLKTNVILRSRDDIVDQLNKLIKTHGKNRDLSTLLIKETGLTKSKINRFINNKDFSLITLDQINSVLNHFHSTLLIVSK